MRGEREDLQHFADIAGAEDLVDDGETVRIVGGEVRGEDAVFRAPPPQELARCARRVPSHAGLIVIPFLGSCIVRSFSRRISDGVCSRSEKWNVKESEK